MLIYLFSAQNSSEIWHYYYTEKYRYMIVYNKHTMNAVRYHRWMHEENDIHDISAIEHYVPDILEIINVSEIHRLDKFIENFVLSKILGSI